jgi:hypothetical protein
MGAHLLHLGLQPRLVVIDVIKVALYRHYDKRDSEQTAIATPLDPFGGRLGKLSKVG